MEGVIATNGKEKVMFEHKTEEEARKEILSMVEGYYRAFHRAQKKLKRCVLLSGILQGCTFRKFNLVCNDAEDYNLNAHKIVVICSPTESRLIDENTCIAIKQGIRHMFIQLNREKHTNII